MRDNNFVAVCVALVSLACQWWFSLTSFCVLFYYVLIHVDNAFHVVPFIESHTALESFGLLSFLESHDDGSAKKYSSLNQRGGGTKYGGCPVGDS